MTKRIILIVLCSIGCINLTSAQWNWPEDKATAEGKNAYYTDNLKNGLYRKAADGLYWLLINAPNLNPSIYINGAKIYEQLAKVETDADQKIVYQDSALLMYDLRIQHFNKEASVLNRKAYKAYRYYNDRKEKYEELFKIYQRTFELNGNNILDNNLVAYMDVARRYKNNGGDLSDEQVIEIYTEISDIIDYKIGLGQNVERLESFQDNLDKLLTSTVTVDCNFVETTLAPKMEEDPEDLKIAKKVFQLLLTGKCSESPYFIISAKKVHSLEPAYGLAIVVAKKEITSGNFEEARKYYLEALELTDDNTKRGEIYLDLATSYAAKENRVEARKYALLAVQEDPTRKEAYSLVGNLYMQSYEDCRKGVNKVEDRGCFLAAYKMYELAGDSNGMRSSKQQFPSIEDIFELDLEEGTTIKVGCWIGETVVIQRRPS